MKLKADLSEFDALTQQIKALGNEIKGSGAYIEGLEKLGDLRVRCDKLKLDTESAGEIVDAGLEEAASLVVDRATGFRDYLTDFVAKHVVDAGDKDELKKTSTEPGSTAT